MLTKLAQVGNKDNLQTSFKASKFSAKNGHVILIRPLRVLILPVAEAEHPCGPVCMYSDIDVPHFDIRLVLHHSLWLSAVIHGFRVSICKEKLMSI